MFNTKLDLSLCKTKSFTICRCIKCDICRCIKCDFGDSLLQIFEKQMDVKVLAPLLCEYFYCKFHFSMKTMSFDWNTSSIVVNGIMFRKIDEQMDRWIER